MSSMSMKAGGIFQFGEFQIDARARTLRRKEKIVTLGFRAFDVLLYFVQNPGKVLTRDELLKNVWTDSFVDENSLAQSISMLRRALDEKPGDNSYIVTLTGRGYQFVAPVQVVAPQNRSTLPEAATPASGSSTGLILQKQTIRTSVITEEKEQLSLPVSRNRAAALEAPAIGISNLGKIAVGIFSVALLVAGALYYRSHQGKPLTGKDIIVLADFSNTTGDAVFDDTLKTALNVSLRQSPFLNVLPDSEVTKTLQQMPRPASTKLTPEVTHELCQRAGSKAYLAGSIGNLGSEYVLALKAVNCQSGDTLAQEQVTAASKEKVLDVLGEAASKLRTELGESLATVQKFDVPLEQATTSSLEALKAYSLGQEAYREKSPAAALPYHQRAIELDPNFAIGYLMVGADYSTLGELGRASEYYTKAFQLREHASEREKLTITATYYRSVTGELDKAAQTFQEEIDSYPRITGAYADLGLVFALQGQYEKAAEITRQVVRLLPDWVNGYANLANYAIALQRFDETRRMIHAAQARKLDGAIIHNVLYALAFLRLDSEAMAEQQQWFADQPEENWGFALASDTEAYAGHVGKARGLTKRAVDSAIRADNKENGAIYLANAALQHAAYGNAREATHSAAEALKLAP